MNMARDAEKAVSLVEKNFDEALDISRGRSKPPEDQTYNNIAIAISEKALETGDYALAAEITARRSLALTRGGQEIVTERGRGAPTSATAMMKQVIQNKIASKGGSKKVIKEIDDLTNKELNKLNKRIAQLSDAQSIIDSIIC